jgi:hypothetical protein
VVPGQKEPLVDVLLDRVLLAAVLLDREPLLDRGELGRRAVLVGRADEQDLFARETQEARVHVGREHRPHEVAEVLDAVDVGEGARYEVSCHGRDPTRAGARQR